MNSSGETLFGETLFGETASRSNCYSVGSIARRAPAGEIAPPGLYHTDGKLTREERGFFRLNRWRRLAGVSGPQ